MSDNFFHIEKGNVKCECGMCRDKRAATARREGAKVVPLPKGATHVVQMLEFKGVMYVALDTGIHYLKEGKLVPVEFSNE